MKTESEQEFHDLMTEFVDCLGDRHTKYVPPMPYRKTKKLPPPEKPSFIISEEGIPEIKINEFMSDYSELIRGLFFLINQSRIFFQKKIFICVYNAINSRL